MSRRASDWPGCLVPKRRDPVQPLRDQRAVEGADADRVLAGLVRVVAEAPKGTRSSRLYWAAARLAEHAAAGRMPLDVGAAAHRQPGRPHRQRAQGLRRLLRA